MKRTVIQFLTGAILTAICTPLLVLWAVGVGLAYAGWQTVVAVLFFPYGIYLGAGPTFQFLNFLLG